MSNFNLDQNLPITVDPHNQTQLFRKTSSFNKTISCVMDCLKLNDKKVSFKVYNCQSCEGKPENICELCFENCHKGHNENMKNVIETQTYMYLTKCSCAMQDHQIKLKHSNYDSFVKKFSQLNLNKSLKDIGSKCIINEIISLVSQQYYERKIDSKIHCLFCIESCENSLDKIKEEYILKDGVTHVCDCKNSSNHLPYEENLKCLKNVLTSKVYDKYFCRAKVPELIISRKEWVEKYFSPVIKFHKTLREQIDKKIKLSPLTDAYINSLKLLVSLGTPFNIFYSEILIKNSTLNSCFDYEFLVDLFKYEPFKKDHLISVKYNSLTLFRRHILEPRIKHLSLRNFDDLENLSPLHRLIFGEDISLLFKNIKIDKFKFFSFLDTVTNQIKSYAEKVDDIECINLANEFFKIIRILLRYNYIKDFPFFLKIAEMVKEVVSSIHNKDTYQTNSPYLIEKIVSSLIFINNDRIFFTQLENYDSNSNKNFYSFENNQFSTNLVYSLFAFSTPSLDNSESIHKQFYDLFIKKYDIYSESIKTLLEMKVNKFVSKEFIYFLNLSAETIDSQEIFSKNSEIKIILENLPSLIIAYQSNEYADIDFLEKISFFLDKCYQILLDFLEYEREQTEINSDGTDLIKKQIYLIKLGFLNDIIHLWYILEGFEKLESKMSEEKTDKIYNYNILFEKTIDILSVLIINHKNPILIPLVFTNRIVDYLLYEKFNSKKILKFYEKCLSVLQENSYKLNFSYFGTMLIEKYKLNDQNDQNTQKENLIQIISPILKIYILILKTLNEKSFLEINSQIVSLTKWIISSEIFKNLLSTCFPSGENLNIPEEIKQNQKNITRIFLIINNISNYSFYLLTEYIDICELQRILYSCELTLKTRKIISETVFRYFLKSPFFIFRKMTGNKLNYLVTYAGGNLIGNYIKDEEEEGQNEDSLIENEDFTSPPDEEYEYDEEVGGNRKQLDTSSCFVLNGMMPLIFNLKKFRTFLEKNYKNITMSILLDYFDKMVFEPTFYAVYKISYYNSSFKVGDIFLIYKIIDLFLKCLRYFIQILLTRYQNYSKHEETLRAKFLLPKYFNKIKLSLRNAEGRDSTSSASFDVEIYLKELLSFIIDEKMKTFNKLPLDYNQIMKMFIETIEIWEPYHKIKENNLIADDRFNITYSEEFYRLACESSKSNLKRIKEIYEDYLRKKESWSENVLYNFFHKTDTRSLEIKKTIVLDLLQKLNQGVHDKNYHKIININEENEDVLGSIIFLFKIDPEFFQKTLLSSTLFKRSIIETLLKESLVIFQVVFIEFTTLNSREFFAYNYLINTFEFLRLLCENHMQVFQTLLVRFGNIDDISEFDVSTFLRGIKEYILNSIEYFSRKNNIVSFFRLSNINQCDYFNNLSLFIENFIIETTQGTFDFNFTKIFIEDQFSFDYLQNYFNKVANKYFTNNNFYYIFYQALRLINCLIEESKNKYKKDIAEIINYKILFEILKKSFKKMVCKYVRHGINLENLNQYESYVVQEGDYEKLIQIYMKDEQFGNDSNFLISSMIYMLLKQLVRIPSNTRESLEKLFKELEDKITKSKDLKKYNDSIASFESFKFFENIIREVEINYSESLVPITFSEYQNLKRFFNSDTVFDDIGKAMNVEENFREVVDVITTLMKVTYIIHPHSLYYRKEDDLNFLRTAYDENTNELKLNYYIDYIENHVFDLIEIRKIIYSKNSNLMLTLYFLDYMLHTKVSVFITFCVNILMLCSIVSFHGTSVDIQVGSVFQNIIFFLTLINNLYLVFLISNYAYFEIFKLNHVIYNKLDCHPNLWIKTKDMSKIFFHNKIFALVWSLFFGITGSLNMRLNFLYSLQLFSIFAVFPTMKVVIISIILRYEQFLAAGLLIVIACILFSSISFYFFRSDFLNKDTGVKFFCNFFRRISVILLLSASFLL